VAGFFDINFGKNWQSEGGGFAGSGLRHTHDVIAFEQHRYSRLLNRGGSFITDTL
jgi:hypothetical protein